MSARSVRAPMRFAVRAVALAVIACASVSAGCGSSPTGDTPRPPMVTAEPAFDATATLVYQDDMERARYTSPADMLAYYLANPTEPQIIPPEPQLPFMSRLSIIAGRGGSGKALRMSFPGTRDTAAAWDARAQQQTPALATHYIQYWARVQFAAPLTGTLGIKWLEGHHMSGNNRIQWSLHWPNGTCNPQPPSTHKTYWQVMDQSRFSACQGAQPVGPFIENVADNQWHRFTAEYRPNSKAGVRDGVARMWIDGVKVLDVSLAAVGVTPPGGVKPWCALDDLDKLAVNDGLVVVKFGDTQTTNTPPWTLDVDDLVWWRR